MKVIMVPIRRVIGVTMATLGIFLAIFYGYMAYSAQESYVRIMCAVTWVSKCNATNNTLMWSMGFLAVGLVLTSVGCIVVVKSSR